MNILPQHRPIFNTLLQCSHQKDFSKGQSLHAYIIKTSLTSFTYLSNSLISFYSKCGGRLQQASSIFEAIPPGQRDVVSWNTLINAYSQDNAKGSSFHALQLLRNMMASQSPGFDIIYPNAHTFAGVFTSASHLLNYSFGQQAHSLAIKLSSFDDVFVGSTVINLYCKAGFLDDARKVFDRMVERNSVTWATLISGYATEGLVKDAVGTFELMRREEADVNEFVVTSVLSGLTKNEFVFVGRIIHGLVIKDGLLTFASVGNALVTMYAKCGSLDDAFSTFELSNNKNAITWSAMVTGYAQSGDSVKALSLFSKMHVSGVEPSEFTLVGVLNACSDFGTVLEGKQAHGYLVKLGFESQMFIMTALVDLYAKCGCVADARKGFEYSKNPDIVLWTSMIGGYVQNGENEDALSLYGGMEMEGIRPNELTMASVLKACSGLAALEQGKQIHARTIKYGFTLELPIGSALSTMYAKCGSLEDGDLVFRRIPTRDVLSWNAMISGLSQNGRGREALALFEEMRLEGTKPDYVTFVNILSACSHTGEVEKGWGYFKMMSNEFGLSPRVEHYACMVDTLGRAGELHEAKEFIESATIEHGMSLWRILLSTSRNHHNYELGAYAGEKLLELGSLESSVYTMLSSIYTALGKRVDVERVRSIMKLRGVSKDPGCSWINLKSCAHVFVVGDLMHPEIEGIRGQLRRLTKLMRDEGYKPDPKSESLLS